MTDFHYNVDNIPVAGDLNGDVRASTADRLIEVAERLFAERGLDGVSLRQIAAEAGTSNNSAVRYHFGSRKALIAAIIRAPAAGPSPTT